ncbi:MAG: hypothetical protein JWR69_4482 [Pedosphaera sp.]|nr:hypothetical protein [Pedosphaera sp.]
MTLIRCSRRLPNQLSKQNKLPLNPKPSTPRQAGARPIRERLPSAAIRAWNTVKTTSFKMTRISSVPNIGSHQQGMEFVSMRSTQPHRLCPHRHPEKRVRFASQIVSLMKARRPMQLVRGDVEVSVRRQRKRVRPQ